MTPPCPTPDQPEPDLLHQLFLEMSNLSLAQDRATLLDLYGRVKGLIFDIMEADPHPNRYILNLKILKSADQLAKELSEEMNLTTFRRLKEHMREAYQAMP